MKCPVCEVDLHMTERQGVEIDYCPKCRGVWLDRGELDKIIEKSSGGESEAPPKNRGYNEGDYRHHDDPGKYYGHKPYKRRESLLGELFDF